jgi:ATP-dependent RNA helicase RhlE
LTFNEFGLSPTVLEGVEALGFELATPIQEKAIPAIMEGSDIFGSAQTGTGKTAAFLLPMLDRISRDPGKGIRAVIIAPTRELAQQIDRQLQGLAYFCHVSSLAVYGGTGGFEYEMEKKAFREGVDVIVATPGRLLVHLAMESGSFNNLEFLVLDEADRMLDMGFHDDIMRIISYLPAKRQNLMFSATMPHKIKEMVNRILVNPVHINISLSKPAEGIVQAVYLVDDIHKVRLVHHLLYGKELKSVLIFTSTKKDVKEVESDLRRAGLKVAAMHSDHEQNRRDEIMMQFANREIPVLVATDILSRGIDVDGIELVINFNVPRDAEDYVHRIGRTARAGESGLALTLVNGEDMFYLKAIERLLALQLHRLPLPEGLSGPDPNAVVKRPAPRNGKFRRKGGSQDSKNRKPRS